MSSAIPFNNEIILFHRQQANRTLKVRIEDSQVVAKIDLKFWSNSDNNVRNDIPCDIVGLEVANASGKKSNKKMKPVKVRFHPEVLKEAKKKRELGEAVIKTVHELLDQLLGHEWTMDQPKFEDPRHKVVLKLRNVFLSQTGFMVIRNELVFITWPLPLELILTSAERKTHASTDEALGQFFASVKSSMKVWAYPSSRIEEGEGIEDEKMVDDGKKVQILEVNFEKNGFKKNVVQMEMVGCPLLRHSKEYDHTIELDQENLFIRVYLRTDPNEQGRFDCSRFLMHGSIRVVGGNSDKKMIDCAQVKVEELRHALDDSLKQHPRRNSTGSVPIGKTVGTSPTTGIGSSEKRPLEVLYQTGGATCIQISGTTSKSKISRFNVSPTLNPPPAAIIDNLISTSPRQLHIIVNDENHRLPTIDECAPSQHVGGHRAKVIAEQAISTSPSDSIDSGMASTGNSQTASPVSASSDGCTVDDSAFSELRMRDRSVSEGFLAKKPISPTTGSIKGILKKTPRMELRSPSFNNGSLRRSTAVPRMLFTRSISECHDSRSEDDEVFNLSGLSIGGGGSDRSSPRMFSNNVFDEEDELSLLSDALGSINSMNDEPTPPGSLQLRKKRVSFSDQVQARIYRSNSSILGQKQKNQKKKEKKLRRRSESESSDTSPFTDDQDTTLTEIKPLVKKGSSLQDLFISPKPHELERHDSGICEPTLPDLVEKSLEVSAKNGSPTKHKLSTKAVSADSAIDCDDYEAEIGEASV